MTVPAEIFPARAHQVPKPTMRIMPDSAMKETLGHTTAWPRITSMCFSPIRREALSKFSKAFGSTV